MFGLFKPKSIWVVHQPSRRATWCSKSDCPKLGRKTTYDVVLREQQENADGELENIIQLGIQADYVDDTKIEKKVRRVGEPTVKLHALGVIAAFTSEKKALNYLDEYFREHQDKSPDDLSITEIKMT